MRRFSACGQPNYPRLDAETGYYVEARSVLIKSVFFVIGIFLGAFSLAHANEDTYKICGNVMQVSSANRFLMLDSANRKVQVRIAWVDAPEDPQETGFSAKVYVVNSILYKDICVDVVSVDSKDRVVGVVELGQLDVGFDLISHGLAWHFQKYALDHQAVKDYNAYEHAQNNAMVGHIGLWKGKNPIPPWVFRANTKNNILPQVRDNAN
jgi:micrococcal nuclease